MNEPLLTKLCIGTGAPLAAITISHATVNAYLQTFSLLVGILVGVLTAISIVRGRPKK